MTRAGLPVVPEAVQQQIRRRLVRLTILSVLLVALACAAGCWRYEMTTMTAARTTDGCIASNITKTERHWSRPADWGIERLNIPINASDMEPKDKEGACGERSRNKRRSDR